MSPLSLANLIDGPFIALPGPRNSQGNNTAPTHIQAPNVAPQNNQVTNAAPQNNQVTNTAPELSIPTPPASADFKKIMTRPNEHNLHYYSVFPSRPNSISASTKPYSDAIHDTNQKRKRRASDLADDAENKTAVEWTRSIVTKRPYTPGAPGVEIVGSVFTPVNVPITKQDTRPAVTEHVYTPIAPKPEESGHVSPPTNAFATAQYSATEHPYTPTAPKPEALGDVSTPISEHANQSTAPGIAGYVPASVAVPITMQDLGESRLAPSGSIEHDLAIRTEDHVKWAQWAKDLHKEIGRLRHIQDLGPYTMNIIAVMIEDGVWPPYTSIITENE